jgi:hypothetical protein
MGGCLGQRKVPGQAAGVVRPPQSHGSSGRACLGNRAAPVQSSGHPLEACLAPARIPVSHFIKLPQEGGSVWGVVWKSDGSVCELTCLHLHDHTGVCRWSLGWRGSHRPPPPWALLDIRVVGVGSVAIIPVDGGKLDWWIAMGLPVRPPVWSKRDDDARADEDPRPSVPIMPCAP